MWCAFAAFAVSVEDVTLVRDSINYVGAVHADGEWDPTLYPLVLQGTGPDGARFGATVGLASQDDTGKTSHGHQMVTFTGNSRAYLAKGVIGEKRARHWSSVDYERIDLRGKELSFEVDVSEVHCGTLAAVYFVAMGKPAATPATSADDVALASGAAMASSSSASSLAATSRAADAGWQLAVSTSRPLFEAGRLPADCPVPLTEAAEAERKREIEARKRVQQRITGYCDITTASYPNGACTEVDLIEANAAAIQTTVHAQTGQGRDGSCNEGGCGVNFGNNERVRAGGSLSRQVYGRGSQGIDTNQPYVVYASMSNAGVLRTRLEQRRRARRWHVANCRVGEA